MELMSNVTGKEIEYGNDDFFAILEELCIPMPQVPKIPEYNTDIEDEDEDLPF